MSTKVFLEVKCDHKGCNVSVPVMAQDIAIATWEGMGGVTVPDADLSFCGTHAADATSTVRGERVSS